VFIVFSCKKQVELTIRQGEKVRVPETQQEKRTVAILEEVGDILGKVYQNPKAFQEANAAIYSEYYEDERVLLKDLLFPEVSRLYKTNRFKSFHAYTGSFKEEFIKILNNGNYPNLKKELSVSSSNNVRNQRIYMESPTDTEKEIFSNSSGVAIYFPYSENFAVPLTTTYFDNVNTSPTGYLATIVSAQSDADVGFGRKPVITGSNRVSLVACMVDDSYCEINPTHIVTVGAEPIMQDPPQTPVVNIVFIGDVRCTKQYDRLISFTGNGGGSELRFVRADGYLQQQSTTGQITAPQNVISVNLKRKEIRKGTWKTVMAIWDSNWEPDNLQQVFAIYEDDTQGSKTFSGSLQTTLKVDANTSTVGTIGYSITVTSNDDIIRQLNWNRTSFYQYNHGGLNNGCGVRNAWTVYDCNTPVMYTMPQQ
jgi:hypothetical protein